MSDLLSIVLLGLALLTMGAVVGWLVGRSRGEREAARSRQLEEELDATRDELARYRTQVADHFAGTSRLLRDLTLQYRSVYEHLAQGAQSLCPGDAARIERGLAEAAPPELPTSATPEEVSPAQRSLFESPSESPSESASEGAAPESTAEGAAGSAGLRDSPDAADELEPILQESLDDEPDERPASVARG